jgi:hypothetical protein
MKWGFGKQQMAARARIEAPANTAANDVLWPKSPEAEAVPSHTQAHPSLELIGQQDERMRVRISAMLNRLDDLATFRDEFVTLTESVGTFAAEYPQLRSKLLETERLLGEEREASETTLRELRALRSENRRLTDDLSEARTRGQELSERTKPSARPCWRTCRLASTPRRSAPACSPTRMQRSSATWNRPKRPSRARSTS